jgi:hypothetical protein
VLQAAPHDALFGGLGFIAPLQTSRGSCVDRSSNPASSASTSKMSHGMRAVATRTQLLRKHRKLCGSFFR